jgi:hypothetical protein
MAKGEEQGWWREERGRMPDKERVNAASYVPVPSYRL